MLQQICNSGGFWEAAVVLPHQLVLSIVTKSLKWLVVSIQNIPLHFYCCPLTSSFKVNFLFFKRIRHLWRDCTAEISLSATHPKHFPKITYRSVNPHNQKTPLKVRAGSNYVIQSPTSLSRENKMLLWYLSCTLICG